ncbi:MAG: DUF1559 domain-containing protein [Pirellulaceae bacterium]
MTLGLLLLAPGCGSKKEEPTKPAAPENTAANGEQSTNAASNGESNQVAAGNTTPDNTPPAKPAVTLPAKPPVTAGDSSPHPYMIKDFEAALVVHPRKIFASDMIQNLLKIGPAKEMFDDMIAEINDNFEIDIRQLERLSIFVKALPSGPREAPHVAIIAETVQDTDFSEVVDQLVRGEEPQQQNGMQWYIPEDDSRSPVVCVVNTKTIVIGAPLDLVQKVVARPAVKNPLNDQLVALDYANQHFVAVGNSSILSPQLVAEMQRELAREELPPAFSPITDMIAQVKSASAVLNVSPDLYLSLGITTSSEENTTKMVTMVNDSLTLAKSALGIFALAPPKELPAEIRPLIKEALKFLASIKPTQTGDRMDVAVGLSASQLASLQKPFLESITNARTTARRMASKNNLKQLAIAIHNFHDTYRQFPVGQSPNEQGPIHYRNGKPLLSWRVHLLPFVGEEPLYLQFKLDEPWNSPHNIKLLDQIPPAYVNPNQPGLGNKTAYLAPVGPGSILGSTKRMSFRNVKDGTSNTIMIMQVGSDKAVPWSKPEDLPYDAKDPIGSLGNIGEFFQACFADGSVHQLKSTIKPATLLKLFNCSDGGIIDFEELRR